MWIFCKHGFISAVQHRDYPHLILLRARVKGDLENFIKANRLTHNEPIEETPDADYRYRVVVGNALFARAMSNEIHHINYPNFKDSVYEGSPRDEAYAQVWMTMADLQEQMCPRTGGAKRSTNQYGTEDGV